MGFNPVTVVLRRIEGDTRDAHREGHKKMKVGTNWSYADTAKGCLRPSEV